MPLAQQTTYLSPPPREAVESENRGEKSAADYKKYVVEPVDPDPEGSRCRGGPGRELEGFAQEKRGDSILTQRRAGNEIQDSFAWTTSISIAPTDSVSV